MPTTREEFRTAVDAKVAKMMATPSFWGATMVSTRLATWQVMDKFARALVLTMDLPPDKHGMNPSREYGTLVAYAHQKLEEARREVYDQLQERRQAKARARSVLTSQAILKRAERRKSRIATAILSRPAPMPVPLPYGVSHKGAEILVTEWMRFLGVKDAAVTRFTADGGIDVVSSTHLAQVKNYTGTVSVEEIRAFFGVATASKLLPWFFTSGGYTREALLFADRVEMPLFIYVAEEGRLRGQNDVGRVVIDRLFPKGLIQSVGVGPEYAS